MKIMKMILMGMLMSLTFMACQKENDVEIQPPVVVSNSLIINNDTILLIKLNYVHSNVDLFQFFKENETEHPTCSFCIYDTLMNNASYNTYLIRYINKEEYEKYEVIFKLDSVIHNSSGICLYGDINNEDLKMNIAMCE